LKNVEHTVPRLPFPVNRIEVKVKAGYESEVGVCSFISLDIDLNPILDLDPDAVPSVQ